MYFKNGGENMNIYVALDSSTLNVRDSINPIKNWIDKINPTKNIAEKFFSLNKCQNDTVKLGIFCNGTYGLNTIKIAKRHKIDVYGVYLPKMFINEKESRIFLKNVIKGLYEDLMNKARSWNIIRREKKYNINSLKILRVDNDWLYYSIYDDYNRIFTIAIDYDPMKQKDIISFIGKLKKTKRMGIKIVLSFVVAGMPYNTAIPATDEYFQYLEQDENSYLKSPILVMNYMVGFKDEREELISKFAKYCKGQNISSPLLIIKFTKNEFYSAEIFFEEFLQEVQEIFKNK